MLRKHDFGLHWGYWREFLSSGCLMILLLSQQNSVHELTKPWMFQYYLACYGAHFQKCEHGISFPL